MHLYQWMFSAIAWEQCMRISILWLRKRRFRELGTFARGLRMNPGSLSLCAASPSNSELTLCRWAPNPAGLSSFVYLPLLVSPSAFVGFSCSVTRDPHRFPSEIAEARCRHSGCINAEGMEDRSMNSIPIQQELLVLRREPQGCSSSFRLEKMKVTVGCTCVTPIVRYVRGLRAAQQLSWRSCRNATLHLVLCSKSCTVPSSLHFMKLNKAYMEFSKLCL